MSTVRKHLLAARSAAARAAPPGRGSTASAAASRPIVSSAEGSWADGTSEAEGMRRWPRSSKKLRYRSRISSEVITLRDLRSVACAQRGPRGGAAASADRGVPDDLLAVVQAGDLSRRGALDRALELAPSPPCSPGGGLPCRRHGCSRPWARTRTPSTRRPAHRRSVTSRGSSCGQQRRPRADRDGVGGGVGARARTAARDPRGRARGAGRPSAGGAPGARRARRPSRSVIGPGRRPSPPWRRRKRSWPVPARKHRSWESRPARDRQPGALGQLAHLGLGQRAEREAHPRQRARREGAEHVALVLALVAGHPQQGPSSLTRA